MIKLSTPVTPDALPVRISLKDKTLILGSCFADSMGEKMREAGFDVMVNPFGTLYNPASVLSAILRMSGGNPYESADCVPMGAGAGKICSFEHHTSFARENEKSFLDNANKALAEAHKYWEECGKVIITFGTSWIWVPEDRFRRERLFCGAVSNCLKRPGTEFSHKMLSSRETEEMVRQIFDTAPDKQFIFTVSPIRHLGDGAHANTLSKAALQLGLESALQQTIDRMTDGTGISACYFPAYETVLDELRDYRFYAEDLVHPSPTAVKIIWERFRECATLPSEQTAIDENEKKTRAGMHRTSGLAQTDSLL